MSERLNQRDTKLMHTGRSSIVELRKGAAKTINLLPSEIIVSNAILNLLILFAITSILCNGTIDILSLIF